MAIFLFRTQEHFPQRQANSVLNFSPATLDNEGFYGAEEFCKLGLS
jgi:hypothetical protein